jgi:hypothetical protein
MCGMVYNKSSFVIDYLMRKSRMLMSMPTKLASGMMEKLSKGEPNLSLC